MMSDDKKNLRWIDHWRTIGVTALPLGYRNVYREDGVRRDVYLMPCLAVLLQELVYRIECWEEPYKEMPDGFRVCTEEHEETVPFDTRVVFADREDAVLRPVDEVSNYEGTIAPGEPDPRFTRKAAL